MGIRNTEVSNFGLAWNDVDKRTKTQIGSDYRSQVGKNKKGVTFGDDEEPEARKDFEKTLDEDGDCSDSAILVDGRHDSSIVN